MNWTTLSDIKRQTNRLWNQRKMLSAMVTGSSLFPYKLAFKGPSSTEIAERFVDVRKWVDDLKDEDGKSFRIVWREINHRVVGRNSLPNEIWIDSLDNALDLIGKRLEADTFKTIVLKTRERHPSLLTWLERFPFKALDFANDWSHFLTIIDWLIAHPRPGVYLRQVDLPGVHTKFIERHRGILAALFDLALPSEAICEKATGYSNFCERYGFRDKPVRIRFRTLDPRFAVFSASTDQDIAINHDTFTALRLPLQRVFITENETNYLAFPMVKSSLVIFGAGYGFEMLGKAGWLRGCDIYYWGDIDTHGFSILDQLRSYFGHANSILMDRETLLEHRVHWVSEPTPERRDLSRLNLEEAALYNDLRHDRLGHKVRLEQERIEFTWVQRFLASLV